MRVLRPRPPRSPAPPLPDREYISPAEYAAITDVPYRTVQQWCLTGRIPAVKLGGTLWRIPKSAVAMPEDAIRGTK